MEKEMISKIMQMFREAEDKDKAAKMLMMVLDYFEPEILTVCCQEQKEENDG